MLFGATVTSMSARSAPGASRAKSATIIDVRMRRDMEAFRTLTPPREREGFAGDHRGRENARDLVERDGDIGVMQPRKELG